MVPDIGDISAGHSPTAIPTMTETAVFKGTPCVPLPATTAACVTLQPMDISITPHTMISTGIVAPHPAHTISPADVTHTTPQTKTSLAPATPTIQHKNIS